MKGRFLLAALLIPLTIFLIVKTNIFLLLGVEFVIGVSLFEFYSMIEGKDIKVYKKSGILIGMLIPLLYFIAVETKYKTALIFVAPFLIAIMIIYFMSKQVIKGEIKDAIREISYTLFGILYISFLFTHVLYMKNLPFIGTANILGMDIELGRLWILATFFMVWASDSMAYFVGMAIGKNKILPKISPKKSVEGSIAGLIAPVVVMIILKYWFFNDLDYIHVVVLGVLTGIFGQLGDFGESLFKRQFEIKDSGNILMGHGGMWDRFDSMLFAIPIVYYYLRFFIL